MYSELIYTRCGEGIDILRGRNPIKNSGFKVFSCSENITEAGFTDLPFLYATAQSKEPYTDPSFMDDAYLYVVPDVGGKYLLNFHPIPFDRSATGDYSHRPGNFINQIFIGQFDEIYPYELFGNESVWDAQKRGEAFYYENAPTPLPQRDDLGETIGYINFDDIAAFVADGRREVLMSTIAFIVSQYSLPPEERKFLVIRDENSKQIELWIAAIESAFSPRMAAGLSFATRLDKFANANKYTVNLNGQYQTQINLQSPNQKLRLRAMIVGVDERDRTNTAAAKALANSPYVILDGKEKTLSVSVDASNPFYRFVTAYDESHKYFCRQFMHMVDVTSPSADVLKLYSSFLNWSKYSSSRQVKDLVSALTILGQFELKRTAELERLYKEIKQEIPRFLQEDAVSSFAVMSWRERAASVVGDISANDNFRDIVCRSYANNAFMLPTSEATKELHHVIKKSAFAKNAAEYLTGQATVDAYVNTISAYKPNDWVAFTELYADAMKEYTGVLAETAKTLLPAGIKSMYSVGDGKNAVKIAALYSAQNRDQTVKVLLENARSATDQSYIVFLIQLVCRISQETIASENNLVRFYKQLQQFNLDRYFSVALAYKAHTIKRAQDIDRFFDWIFSSRDFKGIDLLPAIKALDKNIVISDKAVGRLAAKIQNSKPEGAVCINTAHIYALDALDDRKLMKDLDLLLSNMVAQGFPSIEDETYAERLINKLFGTKLSESAFKTIVSAAANSTYYSDRIVSEAMHYIGTKQDFVIGEILVIAAQSKSQALFDALVTACAGIKQFDKGMSAIRETIQSKSAQQYYSLTQQYYSLIERDARALHEKQKEPSLFGRLFSRGSTNDPNSGKWNK